MNMAGSSSGQKMSRTVTVYTFGEHREVRKEQYEYHRSGVSREPETMYSVRQHPPQYQRYPQSPRLVELPRRRKVVRYTSSFCERKVYPASQKVQVQLQVRRFSWMQMKR